METAVYEAAEKIQAIASKDIPVLVAVDGRCAAGKTTLAAHLHKMITVRCFTWMTFF